MWLENVEFKSLDLEDNILLTSKITEEEIKATI